MRKKFVAGNWKMYTDANSARRLAESVRTAVFDANRVTVALFPPFPYLAAVGDVLRGSNIGLGAQNIFPEKEGAFTGEVSPSMLLDVGCKFVIIGHSERRQDLGESDAFINKKVGVALGCGLNVILCIGETLEQRQSHQTAVVLEGQVSRGLAGIEAGDLSRFSVAYEPIWAIGKMGHHAAPHEVQDAHAIIRRAFAGLFDQAAAGRLVIQYGGSVKPDNAGELLSLPGVDGALVGGASLDAVQFTAIVVAAGEVDSSDGRLE